MTSQTSDESSRHLPVDSPTLNPYATPMVGAMEATGDAWPYELPLAKSKRVRRLAKDADRAPMSIIGVIFLGLAAPFVFTIFFTGHLWSYDRLVRQYPDLLNSKHQEQPIARSFANARGKLVTWACIYGILLAVELAWIATLILA